MVPKTETAFGKVENIVGKGENAGHQHFLLFPQSFSKAFSLWGLCSKGLRYNVPGIIPQIDSSYITVFTEKMKIITS